MQNINKLVYVLWEKGKCKQNENKCIIDDVLSVIF